ncbi:hypothetical protein [Pelagibius sp. Alg239-R121]|uniref:hypothetical protein n=1 Tax=Pelagibius sp. Alg239-R121 TaxID=2993448 RepID=UPI0024A76F64|nr:hypothetical protein [Pelagibius sp. Alg239-R121]
MALIAFAILGREYFRLREFFLLSLAVVLTVAAIATRSDVVPMVGKALDRASFLAAFMILLALLRDGAVTSPSVLAVGRYLTRQPPGRRYLALQTGGHLLGVILNFGCLSLLGPLIQRGVRAEQDDAAMTQQTGSSEITAIRERRQMSALTRGFSWIIAWSPTAITQAFVPLVLTGVQAGRMAAMGAGITLIFFLAGWLEDRVRGARIRARLAALGQLPTPNPLAFPKADFFRFAMVCLALGLMSSAIILSTGSATVPALMLTAPVVTAVWVWLQHRKQKDGWRATILRGREIVTQSIPNSSPEALTLSVAGYSGIMAAGLTDAQALAAWIGLDGIPPLAIYLAVAAIVPLASNLAIPSMLVVTFLGSLFSALPQLGLDPTVLGFALVMGWGLNLIGSPFSATSLVLARVTGIAGTTLSWHWNGVYSLISYGIVAVFLTFFAAL